MSLFNFVFCCFPTRPKYHKSQETQNVFLLDMPDVVMREILKNLDFVTIRKLRKVCHAFRDFIDCENPDSNLKSIDLQATADTIFGFTTMLSTLSQSAKDIQFFYKEQDHLCVMQSGSRCATFQNNCVDLCVDDFLWPALKHQKSLMNDLCVIKKWKFDENRQPVLQNPGKFVVPTVEKLFERLINVLESRDRLLQVESLAISLHGQDQLMQLLRHVDLKVLKRLEVCRLVETEQSLDHRNNYNDSALDLGILKDCKNLDNLHVTYFSISSPFRILAHIPNLSVNMQTIYSEELLFFKNTMDNLNINARSEIRYGQFPDKSRFMEAMRMAENDNQWKCLVFNWRQDS
ncbi:hypothetical protein GCK72_021427 [Caenorhabditis remanei]|uniref:F-box domain-containing protein n=1 Tax=Caenorhabditis remanei TaxID=31234 RepID=A0A6A5GK33_CAERE|nr:hypothetical protein GCK72_021427 [Caenorhabditis remanei]KAF1754862.1 hypothetical protein GCK72_021427 [Caenorhabditis remanei]